MVQRFGVNKFQITELSLLSTTKTIDKIDSISALY